MTSPVPSTVRAVGVQTTWCVGSGLLAVAAGKGLVAVGVIATPLVTIPLMTATSVLVGAPLGFALGAIKGVRNVAVTSGLLTAATRMMMAPVIVAGGVVGDYGKQFRVEIANGEDVILEKALGKGAGAVMLRSTAGMFLPNSATLADTIADEMEAAAGGDTDLSMATRDEAQSALAASVAVRFVSEFLDDKRNLTLLAAAGCTALGWGGLVGMDQAWQMWSA